MPNIIQSLNRQKLGHKLENPMEMLTAISNSREVEVKQLEVEKANHLQNLKQWFINSGMDGDLMMYLLPDDWEDKELNEAIKEKDTEMLISSALNSLNLRE